MKATLIPYSNVVLGEDNSHHYVYRISCLIPEKLYYYLGKHSTKNLEDGYKGSGTNLKWKRVLEKYGIENFKFEIWYFYENSQKAFTAESLLIGNRWKWDIWCCNGRQGGSGGYRFKHSPETIEKIRLSKIGKTQTKESNLKRSISGKGRIRTEEQRRKSSISLMGHETTEETKEKIRQTILNRPSFLCKYCEKIFF